MPRPAVAWFAVAALTLLVTVVSFQVQPHLAASFAALPAGYVFPALALAGLAGIFVFSRQQANSTAFLSSAVYIIGMLTSVVFSVFPMVLPAVGDPRFSLTITMLPHPSTACASACSGLRRASFWPSPTSSSCTANSQGKSGWKTAATETLE